MNVQDILFIISETLQCTAIVLIVIDVSVRFKKIENVLKDLGYDIEARDKLKKQIAQQNKEAKKIKKVGKWK